MQLFGGAISAEVPTELVDGSRFREVPDTQEVYVGVVEGLDVAFVVDLCEAVKEHESVTDAIVTHVDEVHHFSGDPQFETVQTATETINGHDTALRLDTVSTPQGHVLTLFGLFRLPKYETDVFLTYSINMGTGQLPDELSSQYGQGRSTLYEFVKTFKLEDPRLFDTS